MRRLICTVSVSIVLGSMAFDVAQAGPLEDGWAAVQHSDYAEALRIWLPLANQGNAQAQADVGWLYESGLGVPEDCKAAMSWYHKAAELGLPIAQYDLFKMYWSGGCVPIDKPQAIRWVSVAAAHGLDQAQFSLGSMYASGEGVPQDDVKAYCWFTLAITRLSSNDLYYAHNRAELERRRETIAKKMTAAQITEAQREAANWIPRVGAP